MTLSRLRTVVSTNWLRDQLGNPITNKASRKLRVLDTSFVADKEVDTYRECYMQGHIPSSVYFDLHKCVQSTPEIPRNLPDVNCFTDYVQSLGVWPDTHIVAYDRFGPLSAYRTWWLFRTYGHRRISVLDGGLRKWLEDGFEVSTEPPEVEESDFEANIDKTLVRDYSDMVEIVRQKQAQVLDARAYDDPTVSEAEEGSGYIKGAKHVYFGHLFNEDGTIKSDSDLKALFDSCSVDLGQPIVSSCLTGMTACGVAAAAHILGKENVPVYYGSWREWSSRAPDELKTLVKK